MTSPENTTPNLSSSLFLTQSALTVRSSQLCCIVAFDANRRSQECLAGTLLSNQAVRLVRLRRSCEAGLTLLTGQRMTRLYFSACIS